MNKIYQFLSCSFFGFSISGILTTTSKNNEAINQLRLSLIWLYVVLLSIFLILLIISLKFNLENLKEKLFSIFNKDYILIYAVCICFLIGLITFYKINTIQIYG